MVMIEQQWEETHFLICASNGDSNWPAHSRSLIKVFVVRSNFVFLAIQIAPVKILIRLCECAG